VEVPVTQTEHGNYDLGVFAEIISPLFERVAKNGRDEFRHMSVKTSGFSLSLKAAFNTFMVHLEETEQRIALPGFRVLRFHADMEVLFSEIAVKIGHHYAGGMFFPRQPLCCDRSRFEADIYDKAFDAAALEFTRSYERYLAQLKLSRIQAAKQ
jgi:hypothetical protein